MLVMLVGIEYMFYSGCCVLLWCCSVLCENVVTDNTQDKLTLQWVILTFTCIHTLYLPNIMHDVEHNINIYVDKKSFDLSWIFLMWNKWFTMLLVSSQVCAGTCLHNLFLSIYTKLVFILSLYLFILCRD